MSISRWWLASWLEIVVLPTSQSAVRIAGPVGVALSLELWKKKQEGWPPGDMYLKSGKLNQLQIIFIFSNDHECPMDKRFWVRIDFHKSTRR
jgi:hypothetical protein